MSSLGTTLCSRCGGAGCDCRRLELRELLSGLYDDTVPAAPVTAAATADEPDEMWLPATAPIAAAVAAVAAEAPAEPAEPADGTGEPTLKLAPAASLMAQALSATATEWRPQTIVVAAPDKPFLPEPLTRKRSIFRSSDESDEAAADEFDALQHQLAG